MRTNLLYSHSVFEGRYLTIASLILPTHGAIVHFLTKKKANRQQSTRGH